MTPALKFNISCDVLGLTKSFQGRYFGHAFSKACQYASIDEKVYTPLKYISIKTAQSDLQKFIIWPKTLRKGRQEWNKVYVYFNLPKRKLNTLVKTRLSLKL